MPIFRSGELDSEVSEENSGEDEDGHSYEEVMVKEEEDIEEDDSIRE